MASKNLLSGYETTFITKTEITDRTLGQVKDRVVGTVKKFGGEIMKTEDWGRRRLAYPIKKEQRGVYTYFAYTGKPGVVAEVERNLRIQEPVIRFLTVKLGEELDKAKFLKEFKPFASRGREEDGPRARFEREHRSRDRDRGDRDHHRGDRGGYRS